MEVASLGILLSILWNSCFSLWRRVRAQDVERRYVDSQRLQGLEPKVNRDGYVVQVALRSLHAF
jgi:hypothetical protein